MAEKPKEVAIGKRAKISQAQQNMLLSLLIASLFLGAGLSLTIHFIQQISYNIKVIAEEEKSIAAEPSSLRGLPQKGIMNWISRRCSDGIQNDAQTSFRFL